MPDSRLNYKPNYIVAIGFNKELLTCGYIRNGYKTIISQTSNIYIPDDIYKLCLFMYGNNDIIWNINIQKLKSMEDDDKLWSPIYQHNKFQFRLMVLYTKISDPPCYQFCIQFIKDWRYRLFLKKASLSATIYVQQEMYRSKLTFPNSIDAKALFSRITHIYISPRSHYQA